MDSTKEGESLVMSREMLLKIQQKIEKATSELKASGSSSSHLQNLSKENQLLLMKTQEPSKPQIRDGVCDTRATYAREIQRLIQNDLMLLCAAYKKHACCLVVMSTTLDLDNCSNNPSCIFCVSNSN